MLWASERADYFNANFSTDGIPWIAEDFLGSGDREARLQEKEMSKVLADRANRQLEKMIPSRGHADMEDIPIWAIPMKDRKPNA